VTLSGKAVLTEAILWCAKVVPGEHRVSTQN